MTDKGRKIILPLSVVIALLISCSGKEESIEPIDFEVCPIQVVEGMEANQIERDHVTMMMSSSRMERYSYEKDSVQHSYELYLNGFEVKAYTSEGLLETQLNSQGAKHVTVQGAEEWVAYGDVNIYNHIKGEHVITDTVYWDMERKIIYSKCYVRMESPQGLMQGYGFKSDERANNTIILNPFNTYGVVVQDTNYYYIDTVNFVGPLQR